MPKFCHFMFYIQPRCTLTMTINANEFSIMNDKNSEL